MNDVKKALYKEILHCIKSYKKSICKDYVYGKLMGMLEFACSAGIISYSCLFDFEDFVDRKTKYLDRGGII